MSGKRKHLQRLAQLAARAERELQRAIDETGVPVDREALSTILASLRTDAPLASATCRFQDFLAMTKANPDLAAVTVEKIRYGFTIDGIVCEYAKVWFNGALLESACAESEDYGGLKTVVEELGLAVMANTNYLKAAKTVVGMR